MKGLVRKFTSDAGFWSMVDQGIVSAGNFATTILLARALLPAEYGIYALLLALMLFMVSVHSALVAYGLSLQGAAGTDAELRPLVGGSVVLTAGLGTALGMATGATALFFHRASAAPWIFLAVLFWLLQETTRRALMSRLQHRLATWGDALSYLGQAACITVLFVLHRLTLASAFVAIAMTSAAGCAVQAAQLKLTFADCRGALRLVPRFWAVGRWALLAQIAQGFVGQAVLWILALGGLTEVASFQAVLNLLRVTNPVAFAIGSVVLPAVAAVPQTNPAAGLRIARRYGVLGGLILLPYLGVIFIFPHWTLRLLYGAGSAYAGLGAELRVIVLVPVFGYVGHILGMYYFAVSRSDVVFRCLLISAVTTVISGFILVKQAGVFGAAVAYDLTFAVAAAAFLWFLRHGDTAVLARPNVVQPASIKDSSETSH